MKVLILYDGLETYTNTVYEYLHAFSQHSSNEIRYLDVDPKNTDSLDFSCFDAVVIHYSVRVAFGLLPPTYTEALSRFSGLCALFLQDEYDNTERTRSWIEKHRIALVFTCVPSTKIDLIYPKSRFPNTVFVSVLTAYVPAVTGSPVFRPMRDRQVVIGYRGRALPYWYGTLGQEKKWIGQRMRKECLRRGVLADIAWREHERIYGASWHQFLGNCRATLGTESGSNVFDIDGEIRACVERELQSRPLATFSSVFEKYLRAHECPGLMNQVSAKIFEAISMGTALVLYEGEYSGVVVPDRHFIPLKKDFSNVDEVFCRLADNDALEQMVATAYAEVISSGLYSYAAFVSQFDRALCSLVSNEHLSASATVACNARFTDKPRRAKAPVLLPALTVKELAVECRNFAWKMRIARLNGLTKALTLQVVKGHNFWDGLMRQETLRRRAKYVLMPVWQHLPEPARKVLRPLFRRTTRSPK